MSGRPHIPSILIHTDALAHGKVKAQLFRPHLVKRLSRRRVDSTRAPYRKETMTSQPRFDSSASASASSPSLLFVDGDAKTWTNETPLTPRNLVASEPCAGGTYTVGIARRRESESIFELDGLDFHVERLCNDAAVAHNFGHSTRVTESLAERREALEEAVRTNLECALASASTSTSEPWRRAREATVTLTVRPTGDGSDLSVAALAQPRAAESSEQRKRRVGVYVNVSTRRRGRCPPARSPAHVKYTAWALERKELELDLARWNERRPDEACDEFVMTALDTSNSSDDAPSFVLLEGLTSNFCARFRNESTGEIELRRAAPGDRVLDGFEARRFAQRERRAGVSVVDIAPTLDDITGRSRPSPWTLDGCFITNALKGTVPVDFIVIAPDEDADDARVVRLRDVPTTPG